MGLWKKVSNLFSGARSNVLWVYVRCDACGEVIQPHQLDERLDCHL